MERVASHRSGQRMTEITRRSRNSLVQDLGTRTSWIVVRERETPKRRHCLGKRDLVR